jgi:lipoprotein-anchoring transpeptidase ErfK/SrfK
MRTQSLPQKTVRPGSLLGYSYYHSQTTTKSARTPKNTRNTRSAKPRRPFRGKLLLLLLAAIAAGLLARYYGQTGVAKLSQNTKSATSSSVHKQPLPAPAPPTTVPAAAAPAATNNCAGNTLDEQIIVSISQRHLWACNKSNQVYSSPVVTGISYLAADLTPTGTYHIYAKETDQHLAGSDSTGSWNDFVYYWMPFLHNQYGNYGFHDASWRSTSDFGNISPDSPNASHGCVEMPVAAAQWLYNWSYVGTTVTIES